MGRGWRLLVALAGAVPLTLLAGTGRATVSGCGGWSVVPSPNVGSGANALTAVAAIDPGDVWAVGYAVVAGRSQPLAEHWDGQAWSVATVPTVEGIGAALHGVTAVTTTDVWAVGSFVDLSRVEHPLAVHWDGLDWTIVPTPGGHGDVSALQALDASGPAAVWAAGKQSDAAGVNRVLIERWTGRRWTVSPSPNGGPGLGNLVGVAAIADADVWVGGQRSDVDDVKRTLAEHWGGTQWVVVHTPNVGAGENSMFGMAAAGPDAVWMVGREKDLTTGKYRTITERWDGLTWSVVPSPNANELTNHLQAVAARLPEDVWAVGRYLIHDPRPIHLTLTMHWDGTAWTLVPSPNVGSGGSKLVGVTFAGEGDVWAVGDSGATERATTLVEHFC
jgi:hypothetical protein